MTKMSQIQSKETGTRTIQKNYRAKIKTKISNGQKAKSGSHKLLKPGVKN
jgi:hypothetical protein